MTPSGPSAGTTLAVGAACALAVIVLYLVGRRPPRIVVPFAGPWFAVVGARRTARRTRQLRQFGSLALQLGILTAVIAAAAVHGHGAGGQGDLAADDVGPAGAGRATGLGRTVVLLIDRSASMQARADAPGHVRGHAGTRMAQARAAALELIAGLGPRDRAVVVAFAADAAARTGLESDHAPLAAAVTALDASDEPGNLPAALDFAAMLLQGQTRPTLILISDGGGPDVNAPDVVAALHGIDVRFLLVGGDAAAGAHASNLAITSFSARRRPTDPSSTDLSLVLRSFQDAAADVQVSVTAGPRHVPVARRRVHLEPHARAVEQMTGVAVGDARLEARLDHEGDSLPLDDRAFAVVPDAGLLNVITVGAADLYLEGALLSLGPTVTVQRFSAQAIESSRARWPTADVVIFQGVTPDPAPAEGGRYLYLDPDPQSPGSPWRRTGADGREPLVSDVARDHPLMRGLGLGDLNIASARRLAPRPDDTVVARAGPLPLILARDRPGARLVALAFDPRRSDLPMRSAFPLFLANALTWLAQRPEPEALSWPTGRTVEISVPAVRAQAGTHPFRVVAPDGTTSVATGAADAGVVRVTLDRVGFFAVGATGEPAVARVAANLASPEESDLSPRAGLRIGDRTPPPPDPAPRPARRTPGREALLVLLALGLAAGEWVTFHRRITV